MAAEQMLGQVNLKISRTDIFPIGQQTGNAPIKEAPISQRSHELHHEIEALAVEVDQLGSKLTPILSSGPESQPVPSPNSNGGNSPLCMTLEGAGKKLYEIRARLRAMAERIEI